MSEMLRTKPKLFADGENALPSRVQVLRTGDFQYGFEDLSITKEILASMKKNFDMNVRGVDLAIDYGHNSFEEAAGWIKNLELSADGQELWAIVDWTPSGQQKVQSKEFRYLSADFMMDYSDNEGGTAHGPTLMGAGLTNRPFVKEMQPIMQLTECKSDRSKLDKPKGGIKMDEKDKEIADLKAAVELAKSEKVSVDTELSSLRNQLAELNKAKELTEKTAKFEKLLSEGKLCPAQKEAFIAGDAVKLAELAAPVKTEVKGHGGDAPADPSANMDSRDAARELLKLAEKLHSEGKSVNVREGMLRARRENPELVKRASAN